MASLRNKVIQKTGIPSGSMLDLRFIESAYFWDAYSVPLRYRSTGIIDVFLRIFAHHPWYMKLALIIRNRVARWFGLDAASATNVLHPVFKSSYIVGEKIGVWPIIFISEAEIIAGRDNTHLDFRLSVLKTADAENARVTVSTVCRVHNVFGKVYLFFVIPFHKWGVKQIISNAVAAERL